MRLRLSFFALLFFLVLTTYVRAETGMENFTSGTGGFSITMPGTPKESVQYVDSAAGKLELHQFTVEDGNIAYLVMYNDYPRSPSDEKLFFNSVRDGAAGAVKGKVTKEKAISRQGYPGRAFDIDTTDIVFLEDAYLVGRRLYQIILGVPKTDKMPAQANQFFSSFKLAQP